MEEVSRVDFVFFCLVICSMICCTLSAPGNEFLGDDVLIGTEMLFDSGDTYTMPKRGSTYRTTLLIEEGNTDKFGIIRNGYYMGFQWYNSEILDMTSTINIQLYSGDTVNVTANIGSDYELIKETGWIQAKEGLNTYYFEETIPIDEYAASGRMNYIIAIVSSAEMTTTPVLYKQGCTGNNRVWYSDRDVLPMVGNTTYFGPSNVSEEECLTFSMQGLFLPAGEASSTQGSCELVIVNTEKHKVIVSHEPFPGDGYPRGDSRCWILRADLQDRGVKVTVNVFDITPDTNGDCSNDLVQFSDRHLMSDDYVNLWGSYCGEDIFDSKATGNPYVNIDFIISGSADGNHDGFKFSVEAQDNKINKDSEEKDTLAIVLGVLLGMFVVMVISGAVFWGLHKRNTQRGLSRPS